jgi:hypothetical protein
MRHLGEKFKHPDLIKLLWNAARATTKEEYDEILNKMTKINTQAVT